MTRWAHHVPGTNSNEANIVSMAMIHDKREGQDGQAWLAKTSVYKMNRKKEITFSVIAVKWFNISLGGSVILQVVVVHGKYECLACTSY